MPGPLLALTEGVVWPSLPLLFGLGLTLTYAVFAALASVHYPTYSPFHNNTLSQLGNPNLNPRGAGYYLVGCALSGTFAMAFFLSINPWRLTGSRVQNRLLSVVQALGVAGGFGLVMNAVYPENHLHLHYIWSGVVFNCLGAAMLLSPFAFRRRDRSSLGLTTIAALSVAGLLAMFVFARVHWVEWLPVTMLLVSPIVMGFHTRAVALSAGERAQLVR